jgi:hypothetical protein
MSQRTPDSTRNLIAFDDSLRGWSESSIPQENLSSTLNKHRKRFLKWAKGLKVEKRDSPVREKLLVLYLQYGILPGPVMRYVGFWRWADFAMEWRRDYRENLGKEIAAEINSTIGRRRIRRQLDGVRNLISRLKYLLPSPPQGVEEWQVQISNCEKTLEALARRVTSAVEFKQLFPGRGRPDSKFIKYLLNGLAVYIQEIRRSPLTNLQRDHIAQLAKLTFADVWQPQNPEALAKKWIRVSKYQIIRETPLREENE